MAAILTAVSALRPGGSGAATAYLLKNRYADGVVQTASGLQYKVLTPGKGAKPTDTDVALITYKGTLTDGTVFDQSQQPTPLRVSGVVPGFAEALKLMPKGATYRIWIRPELGYGDRASGPIPANSVLVFDVTLVDFLPEAVVRQMQSRAAGQSATGSPPQP
ncbi:FKBP-type peptidyl-prolyl cis-trans isomerase [Sphingomonas sp. RS2018]